MNRTAGLLSISIACMSLLVGGCEEDDPVTTSHADGATGSAPADAASSAEVGDTVAAPDGASAEAGGDAAAVDGTGADAGTVPADAAGTETANPPPIADAAPDEAPSVGPCRGIGPEEKIASCPAVASDYTPRAGNSAGDTWPACISDDNAYHKINPSISTVARVGAFEQMAARLWEAAPAPGAQDFVDARVIYAQDQGLDSRVQRREDVHYPAAASACSNAGVPEANPDRCVGPARLLPILNDAFQKGARGEAPLVQAARIEAALLWFLYVSVLSEVETCVGKPQDCDSSWAYYTGGTERGAPIGLGRYVRSLGPETHERIYDGLLAVRCWRNLDNETGAAANADLRLRARGQVDRALLRGLALVIRDRLERRACGVEHRSARAAFLTTIAPFIDRAARERDPAAADQLKAALAAADDEVSVGKGTEALDRLFPCP